jgi:hypothetical protein
LLRVGVGLGLKRARLENVYSVLRGRDATTGQVEVEKRDLQFALLKAAQQRALSLANWHHFLSALSLAGYRHEGMVWRDTGLSERMNHLLVMADRERVGREASPSAAVTDSQSVKTTESRGPRGYDAGNKVKGRKRQVMVDTDGRGLVLEPQPSDVQDRDGAPIILRLSRRSFPFTAKAFADMGFAGDGLANATSITVEIVRKPPNQAEFVERFFGVHPV